MTENKHVVKGGECSCGHLCDTCYYLCPDESCTCRRHIPKEEQLPAQPQYDATINAMLNEWERAATDPLASPGVVKRAREMVFAAIANWHQRNR